jgi:transcription initiation factor IIE alpha subunit
MGLRADKQKLSKEMQRVLSDSEAPATTNRALEVTSQLTPFCQRHTFVCSDCNARTTVSQANLHSTIWNWGECARCGSKGFPDIHRTMKLD